MEETVLIIQLIIRIIGAAVCSSRASKLNRNSGNWGFFGFISPIIAMIWIYCLDTKTNKVKAEK